MSSIVTGEAVVLELRPASFGARAVSCTIDVIAQVIVIVGIAGLVSTALVSELDEAAARALLIAVLVLVLVVLPVTVETVTRGRSLGRLVMGLRIVRDDGGSIRFRHAFIRGMLAVLETYMLLGSLAFMVAVFNERSKRLGDILAGTYAMRERVAARPALVLEVPPFLQGWSRLADIGRLPDPLARRISQYLSQLHLMSPQARAQLGVELATEASAFVAPPPPEGTTPEQFLTAVSAERRERDFQRLSARRRRVQDVSARLHRLPFN